ncbi:uncharacterized protein LOC122500827 [Leptopilina heterotoma]|uniref:uncharacterized protein LOC122500827 n=1 Tax=Leptopilina heterotoma TaxID=63436 RepID=UPI001CA8A881|nr:uncharacterized protein LOC122500827 [Leptopilina heterotoma]
MSVTIIFYHISFSISIDHEESFQQRHQTKRKTKFTHRERAMSDSVGAILEQLVDRVEVELKEIQCGENNVMPESTSSVSRASGLEDVFSCRICYESHRNVQIVFPCKCKVNKV